MLKVLEADPELARPLWTGPRPRARARVLRGEALFAARFEKVRRLSDFMVQRTRLALTEGGGEKTAVEAAGLMGGVLGWTGKRRAEEVDRYLEMRERRFAVPKVGMR
jgi:glycerol-3-phosphate dehydrogenase